MDAKKLEEEVLQLLIQRGGTVKQEEFLGHFTSLFKGEAAGMEILN